MNIAFPTVIPDSDNVIAVSGKLIIDDEDHSSIIDTTSSELGKRSLSQSIQHLISDYFNIYTVAVRAAYSQAELDYTVDVTMQSTFWSTLIMLPLSIGTILSGAWTTVSNEVVQEVASGAVQATTKEFALRLAKQALPQIVAALGRGAVAPMAEAYEEIYIDAFVEGYIQGYFRVNGLDAKLGQIISNLATSAREAISFDLIFGQKTSPFDFDLQSEVNIDATSQISIQQDTQTETSFAAHLKSLLTSDTMQGVLMSIPGFFIGADIGLGFFAPSFIEQVGDLGTYTQLLVSREKGQGEYSPAEMLFTPEIAPTPSFATIVQSNVILDRVGGIKTMISQDLGSLQAQMEIQLETFSVRNDIGQLSIFNGKLQAIDSRLQTAFSRLEMVNSESDSDENSLEIFVAEAATAADPVYEVNGMKIWIQPLDADLYHLDHQMTLDEFLDRIGVLNDPSKQAIYYNPTSGATYILQEFEGTMPLTEVLDLIGYDRNTLEQQFLGNAHCIQIIQPDSLLQLQEDVEILFHPKVTDKIFYRREVTDAQRSHFSEKFTDAFNIVTSRIQDTFRETLYESAYNIMKARYLDDFGMTQEEWLELFDSKVKDEHGVFTQEFEKIVDLCLKEQVFLNLIELSGAQDQDIETIFSTLDTYLDENFGSLIEQLFSPLTFEAFISELVNQFLNNIDNDGFMSFNVPTQEYFTDLISVQDSYKDELVSVYWGSPPPPEFNSRKLIESEFNGELDALSLLFYRVREYLIDQNIRDLPITDALLGLHGPKDPDTYTRLYLTDSFKDLGLIDDNILQNMHLTQKSFYKTLLEQILLDIQNNPDSSKFKDYSFLIGMQFSLDEFFDDGDQQIVKFIDDIMNKEIGYVGYTLLKLDMIRFDGNGQIKFQMPQDLRTLAKIIRVLGLNSIAEIKTSEMSIMEYLETNIWSMILSGHYMNLMTTDNNGQVDLIKEYTYPGRQFLSGIYKNFMGNIPDSIYHLSMIWNLMNSELLRQRFNSLGKMPNFNLGNTFENKINIDLDKILIKHENIQNPQVKYIFETNFVRADLDVQSRNLGCFITYDEDIEVDDFIRNALDINPGILLTDEIIRDQILKLYPPDREGRNLAFLKIDFSSNGRRFIGLIYAYSGVQLIPGTYIQHDGMPIQINYLSPLTQRYNAIQFDEQIHWFDSERKIILALEVLFDLKNIEAITEFRLKSDPLDFCPSCRRLLNILRDYEYLKDLDIDNNVAFMP